jgi:hypothetical protein
MSIANIYIRLQGQEYLSAVDIVACAVAAVKQQVSTVQQRLTTWDY